MQKKSYKKSNFKLIKLQELLSEITRKDNCKLQ